LEDLVVDLECQDRDVDSKMKMKEQEKISSMKEDINKLLLLVDNKILIETKVKQRLILLLKSKNSKISILLKLLG
jgi:lipopolysaccharide biosynthesis glycosyltransferase